MYKHHTGSIKSIGVSTQMTNHIYQVYRHTNIINGKSYIGYTWRPKNRWQEHLYSAKYGSTYKFHRALRKYGEQSFKHEVLLDGLLTSEQAKWAERFAVVKYDSYINGYNSNWGGGGPPFTEEHRRHLSEAQKKRPPITEETRRKISEANKDKHPNEETRRKISEALKGKTKPPFTEEHRHHLSEACKKLPPFTEDHKRHMSEANKGKTRPPFTEEHRHHLSEANKGKKRPPFTEDHKRHMSEAKKLSWQKRKSANVINS